MKTLADSAPKSIRDLVAANDGKPLWVEEDDSDEDRPRKFFVVGIAPDGWAVGWLADGSADYFNATGSHWKLPDDSKVVIPEKVER